jgi:MraZ protein
VAFRGHYEHSLDAKNRLSIPAKFRASFSGGLVLAKDVDPCIAAWTPEAHEQTVAGALSELNPLGRKRKQLQRFYQSNAFDLELDSAGRVTLPGQLIGHAGIEKDVMVVGVGDHLEIWDESRWQEEQQALAGSIGEVTEELGDPS